MNSDYGKMLGLVNRLNEASDAYYNGEEIMNDAEFDAMYAVLKHLENSLGTVLDNSPTQRVGYKAVSEL